ncbi:MAG: hypothetical protein A2Y10_11855 [Planctomycetes bacterium GWF2_41_51]|nr:MAG: hypothetical protein A2Y10_11855 [Planctomycetes bacterium GWF2_41_51]
MMQQEQIQYLANLYFLAGADKNFEVEEDYILQDVAKGIGAGYLETRKALDLSLEKDFQIKLPKRLSEKYRCLEDMLFLALNDKKFHKMEKEIILKYAKKLGINQEQLDIIREETKVRISEIKK